MRGLDDESKLHGTAELKGTVQVETVSDDDDDDGTAATEECTDEESLGEINTRRELSSVHLGRFASEQRGTAALDVDQYAGSLMRQIGIDDPDDLQPPENSRNWDCSRD